MNAAKTLLVVAGKVWWGPALLMALTAVAGGYAGARVGRRLNPTHLRLGITLFNVAMTAAFFLRA
jgi:uncharacterized membrane protein YfcA